MDQFTLQTYVIYEGEKAIWDLNVIFDKWLEALITDWTEHITWGSQNRKVDIHFDASKFSFALQGKVRCLTVSEFNELGSALCRVGYERKRVAKLGGISRVYRCAWSLQSIFFT